MKKPSTHGAIANTRRVFLEYESNSEGESPATIIAKFSISTAVDESLFKGRLNYGKATMMYATEVKFYQGASNDMEFIPRVYHSEINESQDFILLIEDCAAMRKCADDGEENELGQYFSFDQAKKALCDLAKFHAKYYHIPDHDMVE